MGAGWWPCSDAARALLFIAVFESDRKSLKTQRNDESYVVPNDETSVQMFLVCGSYKEVKAENKRG